MNWLRWLCIGALLMVGGVDGFAASPRILKVLPHYLDLEGRQSVSPSLFERDAYQATLRKSPALCSGLRFDVQWKAPGVPNEAVTMRLEMRTSKKFDAKPFVKEQPVTSRGFFSRWSAVTVEGDAFKEMGEVVAWRITLWREGAQIAEQKSFLW